LYHIEDQVLSYTNLIEIISELFLDYIVVREDLNHDKSCHLCEGIDC
jgi:hypothetical protein